MLLCLEFNGLFSLTVKVQITTAAYTVEHRDSALMLTPLLTKSSVAFETQLLFSLYCSRKGLCSSKSSWGWSKRERAKGVDDIANKPGSVDAVFSCTLCRVSEDIVTHVLRDQCYIVNNGVIIAGIDSVLKSDWLNYVRDTA